MTSIQVLLISLSVFAAVFGSLAFRSKLGLRLLIALFAVSATVFVLFPELTNKIAHRVGVGRGADLLLYLTLFGMITVFMLLYMRTRRLEAKITDQIRFLALRDVKLLGQEADLSGTGRT
ncbi:MAG: DUF2304 domain-containing protein [Acidobacteriota bacterium]|nr:DUF2304 domain-containing protein [Acidobacteriota bacterium]